MEYTTRAGTSADSSYITLPPPIWRLLLLATLAAPWQPARSDGEIVRLMTDSDRVALQAFEVRKQAAVREALNHAEETSGRLLKDVLNHSTLAFGEGYDPSGDWHCRYFKLGKAAGLTVYGWFRCRIQDDGAGWVLHKTTGSQRSTGRFYRLNAEQLLYLGALHYAHEAPRPFGEEAERRQMAVVSRLADGRLRLEFPEPRFESSFDILELKPLPQ